MSRSQSPASDGRRINIGRLGIISTVKGTHAYMMVTMLAGGRAGCKRVLFSGRSDANFDVDVAIYVAISRSAISAAASANCIW